MHGSFDWGRLTHEAAGTSIQQLFNYVNDFYVKHRQERHEIGELCLPDKQAAAAGFAENSVNSQVETRQDGAEQQQQQRKEPELWGLPNVKEEFQEYIWELLKREKDFSVGPKNEGGSMTLKEVVEKLKRSSAEEDMEWRVYATEERRWRVLTGHGPDPKRVSILGTRFQRPLLTWVGPECSFQMLRGNRQTQRSRLNSARAHKAHRPR